MTANTPAFTVRDDGPSCTPVPTGVHPAVCIQIIDLGLQESTFEGRTKCQHTVWFQWELPNLEMDDGRPMVIGPCL